MITQNKVTKLLLGARYLYQHLRLLSNSSGPFKTLHPLPSRTLLRVSGEDVSPFLQGLITNDMRHFDEGARSIYAMFLNNKGRVLYDTLIHKEQDAFLIECDVKVSGSLQKYLKVFKLKRKIQIDPLSDSKVFAFIASDKIIPAKIKEDPSLQLYKDPRLSDLGIRVLASASTSVENIANNLEDAKVEVNDENYKYLRYQLGVSEGPEDLPPGSCFPLEANCDYLHGVSFHKGCYVGQELTARVYHTGVIRKRIMPIAFSKAIESNLNVDAAVVDVNNTKTNIGKLKSYIKNYGIGLLRVTEALNAEKLKVEDYEGVTSKPTWWSVEAPKRKLREIVPD